MRSFLKTLGVLLIVSGFLILSSRVFAVSTLAGNYVTPETQSGYAEEHYEEKAAQKLERGLKNFFLSPLEVPHGVKTEYAARHSEYLPAGIETFFLGAFKGVGNGFKRAGVGFYEIFTFPYVQGPILEEMEDWLY
jgi:putative exosortase-associated protein (TIGR04073 family)